MALVMGDNTYFQTNLNIVVWNNDRYTWQPQLGKMVFENGPELHHLMFQHPMRNFTLVA
jgi:hypothetical protein